MGKVWIFKACRLFLPKKVHTMQPTSVAVGQSLATIPFFSQPEIEALKEEMSSYVSLAADVSEDFDAIEWWKLHARELPNWSAAVKKTLLLQPSSERVFFHHLVDNRTIVCKIMLRPHSCCSITTENCHSYFLNAYTTLFHFDYFGEE